MGTAIANGRAQDRTTEKATDQWIKVRLSLWLALLPELDPKYFNWILLTKKN